VSARIPVITKGLKNRLWAVIIISVSYLLYSSLADFIPRYWEQIGFHPLSRHILKIGMLLILLISLSGLAVSDKMNSLIIRDGLTGLFNKPYIHQRLDEEFYRSRRYNHDLSLMMIDLDNFKALNDRFGHAVGDHLLRYFSQVIADTVRPSDVAARYGGEEFLIILPETRKEEAQTVAERLLNRISLYPFRVDSRKEDVPFTISIGVTAYPDHGESAEDLVELADQALYEAKKNGKNKVAVTETVH
jgi:diguanylate cyclase (GGDEF)-like protein